MVNDKSDDVQRIKSHAETIKLTKESKDSLRNSIIIESVQMKTSPTSGGVMFGAKRGSPRQAVVFNSDLQQVDENGSYKDGTTVQSVI